MPAIDAITEAHIWLQATLSADAGVTASFGSRIYRHPAPRDVPYPQLTYAYLGSPRDLLVVGTHTFWSTVRFLVTGYVEGNDDTDLTAGVAAVKDALHGRFGFTDNANINSCIHDRPVFIPEVTNSVQYLRIGGEYVITIHAKS